MAEPFDTLLLVQERDTGLDQLRHRIGSLPERAALKEVRVRQQATGDALAGAEATVKDLSTRQRTLEERIATTARRRHQIEQRMDSGEVTSSRDLQAMSHEIDQLGVHQSELEEEELALLEEEEPIDAELAALVGEVAGLTVEAERLQSVLSEAEVSLRVAIAAEEAARADLASAVPPELYEHYERLRSRLGGVGAARLVGDHCDGCHLGLSSVDLEKIRRLPPDELAICPECDRILVR